MLYYNPFAFNKLLFNEGDLATEFQFFYWNRASICKFDRSGLFTKFNIDEKYSFKSVFDLPSYNFDFNLDFEEVFFKRTEDIINNNEYFNLWWSGGLDSTSILLSFHQYKTKVKNRLKIICTKESVNDNPQIFEKIIKPNYEYVIMEKYAHRKKYYSLNENRINVTGDNNECVFGWSGILQLFMRDFGSESVHTKLTDISKLEKQMTSETYDQFAYFFELKNIIEETFPACPIKIESILDLNWWFVNNFCWQYDYYRFMVPLYSNYEKAFSTMCPFFATDDFENWIVNNFEEKMGRLENLNYFKYDEINFIKKYFPEISPTKLEKILPRKSNVDLDDLIVRGFLLINDDYELIKCPKWLDTTFDDIVDDFKHLYNMDEIKLMFD